MKRFTPVITILVLAAMLVPVTADAADKLKLLIIDGQNNHKWMDTTPVLKTIFDDAGRFDVDVATSPPKKQPMDGFSPKFSDYDVVVSNYNGDEWCEATKAAFVEYMKSGGGLVSYHAADNSFPRWPEYNEMIGVGGWGHRNETAGPMVRWRDGKMVLDNSPGKGGSHSPRHDFQIISRDPNHPVMAGLPEKWMHWEDELYCTLRGPAKRLSILATAYSDPAKEKSTGEHEPMLMTIRYGKGRIFHTTLGHAVEQMRCVGFITTLIRGTEWAATGKVTLTDVPSDFPTADKVSLRETYTAPTSEK